MYRAFQQIHTAINYLQSQLLALNAHTGIIDPKLPSSPVAPPNSEAILVDLSPRPFKPLLLSSNATTNTNRNLRFTHYRSSHVIPSFVLRAFAILGHLQPTQYLQEARRLILSMHSSFKSERLSPASFTEQFFALSFQSDSPILTTSHLYSPNDPVRLAFAYLAQSLSDSEDDANRLIQNEQAFRDLFQQTIRTSMIWEVAGKSTSIAWSMEHEQIAFFTVSRTKFLDNVLVVPETESTWFEERSLVSGIVSDKIQFSCASAKVERYLSICSYPLRAFVAAAEYGADWDYSTKPFALSRLRNMASWKMDTSGGVLFRGVYMDSADDLLNILWFGSINNFKMYDVIDDHLPDSNSIRDIVRAIEAARSEARNDSRTFRDAFISKLVDIRREIRGALAKYGTVFRRRDRYMWIGVEGGRMRMKTAVRLDTSLETADMNIGVKQDAGFLVRREKGIVLGSTSEMQSEGLGDLGECLLFACLWHGRIGVNVKYEHLLRRRVAGMKVDSTESTCHMIVDTEVMYRHLLVLSDSVMVDCKGQGWLDGISYVGGRDGRAGWVVAADEGSKGRFGGRFLRCALVAAEFDVCRHLKIAPM